MSVDFRRISLGQERIDYQRAWNLQREIHADVVTGARGDTVLLLEHPPVYTAGRRTEDHERPQDGTPVVEVDRGGKITWHGPGQLVGYPIVALPEALGVVDYVRRLEEALIAALAEYGIGTGRVRGRSGVWLAADPSTSSGQRRSINWRERKIAAIGVRVAGGVTMHGFAVNVDPDLGWFDRIVPCGLTDVGVTSVAAELGRAPSLTGFADVLEPQLQRMLAFEPYVQAPDLHRPGEAPARPDLAVTV